MGMPRGIYVVALVIKTKNLLLQYEDIIITLLIEQLVTPHIDLTDLPVYFSGHHYRYMQPLQKPCNCCVYIPGLHKAYVRGVSTRESLEVR